MGDKIFFENGLEQLVVLEEKDISDKLLFNIFNGNKKLSIATDIGHMDNKLIKNLEDSLFILLESNYDPEIIKYSRYPYSLKSRITGPLGHLSNDSAGKTISYLLNSGLKSAMLGHLSKENNFPELAYKTVVDQLMEKNNFNTSLSLSVADRNNPGKLLEF